MDEPTERTGYRWLTCQISPVLDTDVKEGKVVTRQRFTTTLSDSGTTIVSVVADSPAEGLRKVAMYLESEDMNQVNW